MARTALYLTGGGARGAYQVGALQAIDEILKVKIIPFDLITGVSVGSINASMLAQYAEDFPGAIKYLESLWLNLRCQDVFNTSNFQLAKSLVKNFGHLFLKNSHAKQFLDTRPFENFIKTNIDFSKIKSNISNKLLGSMEVISLCYETQQSISFYQNGYQNFKDWQVERHVSKPVEIDYSHILASSALPIFFPPVEINGLHYGDGSLGLVSPLRGAIRFDIENILIVGTRQASDYNPNQHNHYHNPITKFRKNIGLAHIMGNIMQGIFLDNLDRDIEMMEHMNHIVRLLSIWKKRYSNWRPIETLHLRPTISIASIAQSKFQAIPGLLRLFLNLLGAQNHCGDLLSFLLFEREFTQELIKLGYHDTMASHIQITKFFKNRL